MENISYDALETIGYKGYLLPKDAPEKVRSLARAISCAPSSTVSLTWATRPPAGTARSSWCSPSTVPLALPTVSMPDDLYTVLVRGKENGNTVDESRVISACSRCLNPYREDDYRAMMEVAVSDDLEIIVSNTTEAGIAYDPSCKADDMPPASFPAKLAQVLHTRWAAGKPGVIVLACELIDHNGEELLRIMNQYVSDWGWEDEFAQWMANDCTVCTTLVDTIVPGRIRDPKEAAAVAERLGYEDPFLAVREPFQMWGIQGDESLAEKLPFVKAGLPGVFVTPDVTPYKKRKVRILNGAHTAFVPGSWVAGFDIVRDCMHDETIRGFMNTMLYDEVIPTLAADLDVEDCKAFAAAVENRFDNPFIDHALLSICLNSTAKWRARDLPTLKDYVAETGNLPKCWRRASLRSSPSTRRSSCPARATACTCVAPTAPSTPLRTTPSCSTSTPPMPAPTMPSWCTTCSPTSRCGARTLRRSQVLRSLSSARSLSCVPRAPSRPSPTLRRKFPAQTRARDGVPASRLLLNL
ncbi:MAG: tagaturonate reductase [Collinsella sp.]